MRNYMLLLYMPRVQRAVLLELRNVLFTFSDPKKKYVSNILILVLPTYQLSCHERLTISKAIKEYRGTQRIPFIGEKSTW